MHPACTRPVDKLFNSCRFVRPRLAVYFLYFCFAARVPNFCQGGYSSLEMRVPCYLEFILEYITSPIFFLFLSGSTALKSEINTGNRCRQRKEMPQGSIEGCEPL